MSTIDELKKHFEYVDLLKRCAASMYATIGGAGVAGIFEIELEELRERQNALVSDFAEELKQKHLSE